MSKIKITSTVPYTISWYYPEYRINNIFTPKKNTLFVEEETLKELMFYPGAKAAILNGELAISDEDRIKIGLGSEDPEVDKEMKPIVLSEEEMTEIMTKFRYNEFKEKIEELPSVQIEKLIAFAIQNQYTDYAKCSLLKKLTGVDIQQAVKLAAEEVDE
jgi:hypothetical protein